MSFRAIVVTLLVAMLSSGCALKSRESGALFDRLKGKGPMLIEHQNETVASTVFFRETWRSSAAVKHLVTQRGTPEALSVEREFLKPNRMKLFYPRQGQVYILDLQDGEWLVSGSEPLASADYEQLARSQSEALPDMIGGSSRPLTRVKPAARPVVTTSVDNHDRVPAAEFRGRLKAPSIARVATLTKRSRDTYAHTVTFRGETLEILADWYGDDPTRKATLGRVNKRNPLEVLHVGETILIPASIMVNSEPLPEAFVP
jgi:hypothetical protein